MSESALASPADLGAWLKEHKVCWELAPLRDLVKGRGVEQTGYELNLFGRFDLTAQDDDDEVAHGIHERLRALALDALRSVAGEELVTQVEPFSREVVASDARSTVEVELTVIVCPAHPEPSRQPAETRRQIALVEGRLLSMGLHKRA